MFKIIGVLMLIVMLSAVMAGAEQSEGEMQTGNAGGYIITPAQASGGDIGIQAVYATIKHKAAFYIN